MAICTLYKIPVKILSKRADWIDGYMASHNEYVQFPGSIKDEYKKLIAFGFTLTGHDELEPNASTNAERIQSMKKLHESGFKTFASIEPIIDFESSFDMIWETNCSCDLYKIGLESGKKYDKKELNKFIAGVIKQTVFADAKIYFKDSLLKQSGINREDLPKNCVTRDYNLFK